MKIQKGLYGEVIKAHEINLYKNVRSMLNQAVREGKIDAPYCDVDSKHRGSALNYDVYDFKKGAGIIQRRETTCTKYGNSPKKDYFMISRKAGKVTITDLKEHKMKIARRSKACTENGQLFKSLGL